MDKIKERLKFIYGEGYEDVYDRLRKVIDGYKNNPVIREKREKREKWKGNAFSEKDSVLIVYGDSIKKEGEKPLVTLHDFLKEYVENKISGVHILPFFLYSSDEGFSVIDYKKVEPKLGDWDDIIKIGKDYRLMVDLVINHVSQKSEWFQGFLRGDKKYKDYFKSQVAIVKNKKNFPGWIQFDVSRLEGKIVATPTRQQIGIDVDPEMVIAYYSR